MKIGIVTVFFTENCGSVLQATALSEKLKQYGHEVSFIDTRNKLSGHSRLRLIKNCIKALIKQQSVWNVIKNYIEYSIYIKKNFRIVTNEDELDMVVIGSDTVWDVSSDYFMLSQDIFWAKNINVPISTYATSIANSKYESLDSLKYPAECLKKYKYISVRDYYTKEYVNHCINFSAEIVCDPTLLHSKNYYINKCRNIEIEKFILLYLFDEPNDEIVHEIKRIAKKKRCKIVSIVCMGKRLSCADIYIEASVDNFLSYFNCATVIVTNTFHGTVFATIFNKNFIVIDYKKIKIYEFLKDVNLTERITTKKIMELLDKPIDFFSVNKRLNEIRHFSEKYIEIMLSTK